MHIAIGSRREDLVRMLMETGGDAKVRSDDGSTPLHVAVRCPAVVPILLDAGAEINATDKKGLTPLHRAAGAYRWCSSDTAKEVLDVIIVLLEAGADAAIRDEDGELPEDKMQMICDANGEFFLVKAKQHLIAAREAIELEQSAAEGRGNAERRRRI